MSVDIILVNICSIRDVVLVQEKITSKTVLFDSRIRYKLANYSRYDAKQFHWRVGGATSSLLQYTLFCDTTKYK